MTTGILRILNVEIIDSSNIAITFTSKLTKNLIISNCNIIPDNSNIIEPSVLSLNVNDAVLTITCQPLTNLEPYYITFKSIENYPFTSINGDFKISEDNVSNRYLILGPIEQNNLIQTYLKNYLRDNIYDIDDNNTIVSKYIRSLSENLSRALYDIRQVKNENYISTDIIDERKIRSDGPFDRLNEESAYEVVRVATTKTDANNIKSISIASPTSSPITLQQQSTLESLTSGSTDEFKIFNINDLILNLSNYPVTKVTSIVFTLNTNIPIYVYDITKLGYQILDSKYDKDFGFTYQSILNNQIKLNESILSDTLFSINSIIKIDVKYEYKNLGLNINNSVSVFTSKESVRETLPPIINIFSLKYAPIISSDGSSITSGGILFTDPNTNITNAKHPAFVNEIEFRLNALPNIAGQYSIDYINGRVYVYGASSKNDGTGAFPPLATYNYKYTYKADQDYTYDQDLMDLVALPNGNLFNNNATISFNYEQVLVPGIDYNANIHIESLNERINNNLLALNALKVAKAPITNVFKIYNETSGEIYTLDRWNNDKIYFLYNIPPKIESQIFEKTSFKLISNELLFVDSVVINVHNFKIFKILLKNNSIISLSEDCFASSINTSLTFSDKSIFTNEIWYDSSFTFDYNYNKLITNQYCVDYTNGVIYCAVSNTQTNNIGTATYKINNISLQFPHLISVDDIYYQNDSLSIKNKHFDYIKFSDGYVLIDSLDNADEKYLNNNISYPYIVNNSKIGTFVNSIFANQLSNPIKSIRGIFEFSDLTYSFSPINFANTASFSNNALTTNSITKTTFDTVKFNGINYYVTIPENIQYISNNITYNFQVIRASDSQDLWNSSGTVVTGSSVNLILSGAYSPAVDDLVEIIYSFTIKDLSRVIVDYNKGDLFVDYTYLADEIIVSYEYGDNELDFRKNTTLATNSEYFVTYRVGALRDALLKNFGNLINIQELTNFDVNFPRERYRDAVYAALSSFIQGPTLTAIKNIVKTISHVEPEIIESIFNNWSLGSSILYPQKIQTTGEFNLLSSKFGNGVLINEASQSITIPGASTLRLEEGTFETWVTPQWDGIDNDANLIISTFKDGYAFDFSKIFIGASEYHPLSNKFAINKNTITHGLPNLNKDGVFIYYDYDLSKTFKRWFINIVDGYVTPDTFGYKISIDSDGIFYDVKSVIIPQDAGLKITTKTNNVTFNISNIGYINEGITFVSDLNHYLLDFAKEENKNRFSLYKDISGYLTFKVYDKNKNQYITSADVSSWKQNDLHHVAISWKLNTLDNKDEMHLFIDGLETANIIKYDIKAKPYLHEKFKTINLEEYIYLAVNDIVGSNDLIITSSSNIVKSSINFSSYNLSIGNTIFIDEPGFDESGYIIIDINGQSLMLNSSMPITLTNAKFSINKIQINVTSDIDIAPKTAVTRVPAIVFGDDGESTSGSNIFISLNTDFINSNVLPGYLISIEEILYTIIDVSTNYITIADNLTSDLADIVFYIYKNFDGIELQGIKAVSPDYSISKNDDFNNILTILNGVYAEDLLLIKTFGINNKIIKTKHYIWGDGVENVIMTKLPPPISLDETKITKIILPPTIINNTNATLIDGIFDTNIDITTYQPTNTILGRTLAVNISGNNIDFTTYTTVTIEGENIDGLISESIIFSSAITQYSVNYYTNIYSIYVATKPINPAKTALTISIKEQFDITHSENSGTVPIIRYAYPINQGFNLSGSINTSNVTDNTNLFSSLNINNYLNIISPAGVAGYYKINSISNDRKTLILNSNLAQTFTDGYYQVLNISDARSGFQNGFFTFEEKLSPATPFFLNSGFYELEYATYMSAKFDSMNEYMYIGSDFNITNQFNGIINSIKVYSTMLDDTRIGEDIPSNQRSITKDYNSLKPLNKDINTIALISLNDLPFINEADVYTNNNTFKNYFQSSLVVNENFGNSLVILDNPIEISNDGILDTKKEGAIEFWTSPLFDTGNDPNIKYYFDANSAIIENAVSINNSSIKLLSSASKIISIKMTGSNIDYFAGGSIEIDTQRAIQEEIVSLNNSSVTVSNPILQVVSVKIIGDLTNKDYFGAGTISANKLTIYLANTLPSSSMALLVTYQSTNNLNTQLNTQIIRLNKKLPYENSNVIVTYIPKDSNGDRVSIYKDNFGYINFGISASGIDYVIRGPTEWSKGTWHRVKASYKINGIGTNSDEIRLFIDGYQYSNMIFGTDLIIGSDNINLGSVIIGDASSLATNIKFKDQINSLFIGSEYNQASNLFGLIDNLRISNISRPIYAPYNEPIDVNYSSNLSTVFPVTQDLYTTYLMDYNSLAQKNTNFTLLTDKLTGAFDFTVNIFDSFDIVSDNATTKQTLEKLLSILKPAQGKVKINYQ